MPVINLITEICAPIEVCFDLSRSIDLHANSMVHTGERAVAGRMSGLIGPGEEVTWEARHFGIKQRHTSRITAFTRPTYFQDRMVQGAFRSFVHDHYFEPGPDGVTIMRDVIRFSSPVGLLGRLVDRLFMGSYLTRLIAERNDLIKREAERCI